MDRNGHSVAYEYDELGRLTEMRDAVTTTTYSYDGAGRVTGVGDADGFTIGYAYDAAGNVTQVTYPDGSEATYAYDALNRLTSVTTSEGETASYSYDAAGRLVSGASFDGIATTYTHDAAGGLTGMSSVVASYFFTRDGNGRIVHSIETEPLAPSPVAGSTEYSYNDKKNRLLSAGAVAYGYDDEGQLTSAGSASYSYDCEHRLAAIGSGARFEYDGRGNRLRATRGGVVTRYIYDPWGNFLAEADGNGNITRTYIYGHGLLAMRTAGGGLYCYHFNATGSTIAVTDSTGGIVNSYAYDPFGNVLGQQEGVSQPFKFVGQYGVMAEANDSLYYMRARYYDPRVGRFISEDPIGFAGGDVNLFAYVSNNPINYVDPLGLFLDESKIAAETGTHVLIIRATQGALSYLLFQKAISIITSPAAVGVAVFGGIVLYPSALAGPEDDMIPIGSCPAGGVKRSSYQKAKFLKQLAESGMAASWMNQWLREGLVPPGYEVDHIIPLSIGGADTPENMRLLDKDFHSLHHSPGFYRPWQ